jgi:hypothetical protein
MENKNSQSGNLIVPVSILVTATISAISVYFGWYSVTWSSAPLTLLAVKICSFAFAFFALLLTAGYFAARAGYTRDELEQMGTDAMSGKPPI